MSDGYEIASLDEIETPGLANTARWASIRRHFGIESFGVNAWSADAGDDVIGEHDEVSGGAAQHEELYVVLSGKATFTVDGQTVDASAGTIVFVRDPAVKRRAVADDAGTRILAIGAKRGEAFVPSPWERSAPSFAFFPSKEYDKAVEVLSGGAYRVPGRRDRPLQPRLRGEHERPDGRGARPPTPVGRGRRAFPRARPDQPDFDPIRDEPGSRRSSPSRRSRRRRRTLSFRIRSFPSRSSRNRSNRRRRRDPARGPCRARRRRRVAVGVVAVRAVVVPVVAALRRRRCVVWVVAVRSVVVAAGARFSRASRLATGSATVSRAIMWAANPSPDGEDQAQQRNDGDPHGEKARRGRVKPRPSSCSGFAKTPERRGSEPLPAPRPSRRLEIRALPPQRRARVATIARPRPVPGVPARRCRGRTARTPAPARPASVPALRPRRRRRPQSLAAALQGDRPAVR